MEERNFKDFENVQSMPSPMATRIWLCKSDIDITSGHQIVFNTREEQVKYFTDPKRAVHMVDDGKYIRNKSGELLLDAKFVDLDGRYNYLIYNNTAHEDRYYFCNIIDYQYTNERVSKIFYSVDNLQTYWFDLDLTGKSFIARRHYTRNERRDILNLPYEDLDRGRNSVLATDSVHRIAGSESFYTITLTDPIHKLDEDYTPIYNQYEENNYVNEKNQKVKFSHNSSVVEGAIIYIVNASALKDMVQNIFNTPDHVNKIAKISYIPFDLDLMGLSRTNLYKDATGRSDEGGKHKLYIPSPSTFQKTYEYNIFNVAKNMVRKSIKGDFSMLENKEIEDIRTDDMTALETYFMRQPFVSLQLADVIGNVTEYDYKVVGTDSRDTIKLNVFGSLGTIPTIAYNVDSRDRYAYNQELFRHYNDILGVNIPKFSDLTTKYIVPTETITIKNDYLSAFLQGNQNQINQQRANVDMGFEMKINDINANAQRSLSSTQLAYNNSMLQKETEMTNFGVSQGLQQNNHNLSMIGQGINSVIGLVGGVAQVKTGGGIGGVVGAVQGGINAGLSHMQFGNSLQANSEMFNNSMNTSLQIANTNLQHQQSMITDIKAQNLRNASLQKKMTLDTMNARMLDVENAPSNLATLTGGTLMNVLYNRYNIHMRVFMTHPYAINRLTDYLLEYGFLSNTKESIHSIHMKHKDGYYIQTVNANIRGDVPQSALNDIKEQFDNGVFIWKKPELYRDTDKLKDK